MKRHTLGTAVLTGLVATVALAACAEEPQGIDPTGGTEAATTSAVGPTSGAGGGGDGGATGVGTGTNGTSGTTNPTGGGPTAQEMFITDVYPKLSVGTSLGLACTTCHAVGTAGAPVFFATAGAEASYNAIVGYTPSMIAIPDNSTLVLHGTHSGPALDPAQLASVSAWLNQEVIERGLDGGTGTGTGTGTGSSSSTGGGDPPLTLALALEQFGDCMSLNDWIETGMDNLPEQQTEIGPCQGCHNAGDGGAWLSANDEETFERNRIFPYVRRLVSGTVDENGAFDTLIAARRFIEKGGEGCDPNLENCHPQFVLSPNNLQAVEDFVEITIEKWENNECEEGPPGTGGGGGAP